MKSCILIAAFVHAIGVLALAQTSRGPEERTFEVTPVAPPSPALKYSLVFDNSFEIRPGNAAILYLESILLMGQDAQDKSNKALAAYDAKDMTRFNSLADALANPSLLVELDLAGRRAQCDWEPPLQEMGGRTLLPHLSPLVRIGRLLKVLALRQIQEGNTDEAMKTLRLGYALSSNVAKEPLMISGLVSISIESMMNDSVCDMMNRTDCPNLYWALGELPSREQVLRKSLDGEGEWWTAPLADLDKWRAGQQLSAGQWSAILEYIDANVEEETPNLVRHAMRDPVKEVSPELMRQASEQYAATYHMTAEQVSQLDPIVVVGNFYFEQYQVAFDDIYKLRGLPYPILLAKSAEFADHIKKLQQEQPTNLCLVTLPNFQRAIWAHARADRQVAAMTAVEAIRSYAADNAGKLPSRLEDVTSTPVPDNPVTGLPFEYGLDGDVATISDTQSEEHLTYTVRIRK